MLVQRLSSAARSFSLSTAALHRAGLWTFPFPSHRPLLSAAHPCWSCPPCSRHFSLLCRQRGGVPNPCHTANGRCIRPGDSYDTRSLHSSAGLMEGWERGPPFKRWKSTEERSCRAEAPGEPRGLASEGGGPSREHRRPGPGTTQDPPSKSSHRDRSRDGEKTRDWKKSKKWEKGKRDKRTEIVGGVKDRTCVEGTSDRSSRTQEVRLPQQAHSKPDLQIAGGDVNLVRGGEGQGPRGGGLGVGPEHPRTELSPQPPRASHCPNPWFPSGAWRPPLPPGPLSHLHGPCSPPGGPCPPPGGPCPPPGGPCPPPGGPCPPPGGPCPPPGGLCPPPGGPCPPPGGPCPPPHGPFPPCRTHALQRRWEDPPACSAELQPSGAGAAFQFSVLSYNILSQDLLQENSYLYRHCDARVLPWEFRLSNLLAEIRNYNADILCLQEVQQDHYHSQMKPALEALGYQCVYKKRTGKKPDGCAVVFKTSRLSLLSSHPVEFLRPGDALLDRDNVGLVLLLRPNDAAGQSDPSSFICVGNTHLLYNPRRGDVKLAQLAILLAEISRLSRLPDGSTNPVVLCGDFNSVPWSPLYRFLTTGCLKYKGLTIGKVSGQEDSPRAQRVLVAPIWSSSLGISAQCEYKLKPASSPADVEGAISALTVEDEAANKRYRLRHGVKLQSSYQHRLMHDGRPEITTCHSRTAMTVDYILYTPDSTSSSTPARGLQLQGRLALVGESELKSVRGLPNQHHSSDHLPLLARFRLRR